MRFKLILLRLAVDRTSHPFRPRIINSSRHKFLLLLIACLLITACTPQAASVANSNALAAPVSWFDAPLPGGSYPLGPIQVVSHHSDPGCLSQIEFSVNDQVANTQTPPDSCQSLITDARSWTPPGPGEYKLQIRAQGEDGQWGNYAETRVTILAREEILVEPDNGSVEGVVYDMATENPLSEVDVQIKGCGSDQSQTTGPDGVFRFSDLPAGQCMLEATKPDWIFSSSDSSDGYPVPVQSSPNSSTHVNLFLQSSIQLGFGEPSLSTPFVYNGDCRPGEVTFQVQVSPAESVRGVTLFFRVVASNGDSTPWSNGEAMKASGGGFYTLSLTGGHLDNDSGFTQATVKYQFVIEPASGQSADFVRSEVFSDLTLLACGQESPSVQPTSPTFRELPASPTPPVIK